jgi:hypothetical protein
MLQSFQVVYPHTKKHTQKTSPLGTPITKFYLGKQAMCVLIIKLNSLLTMWGKKRKLIRVKPSDTQYLLGFKAPTIYL